MIMALSNKSGKGAVPTNLSGSAMEDYLLSSPPEISSLPKQIGRKELVRELSRFGTISEGFRLKLGLPNNLFKRDMDSFSSDKEIPAYLFPNDRAIPLGAAKHLPKYSISIGSRGSDLFATLVDTTRGIVVTASLNNMMAKSNGTWDVFEDSLDTALEKVKQLSTEEKESGKLIWIIN